MVIFVLCHNLVDSDEVALFIMFSYIVNFLILIVSYSYNVDYTM